LTQGFLREDWVHSPPPRSPCGSSPPSWARQRRNYSETEIPLPWRLRPAPRLPPAEETYHFVSRLSPIATRPFAKTLSDNANRASKLPTGRCRLSNRGAVSLTPTCLRIWRLPGQGDGDEVPFVQTSPVSARHDPVGGMSVL